MNPDKLLDGFDTNGMLGELTQIPEAIHHKLFQQEFEKARRSLEQARIQASSQSKPITIDASRLSGTNGFDNWVVYPSGKTSRKLLPFDQARQQLEQHFSEKSESGIQLRHKTWDAERLFARMAYNGLWSPSGTNSQPIRSVVISPGEASSLFKISTSTHAMVVLRRTRYSSILGDVASLCGISHDPHAEYIDLGIWMQIAINTALGHGWTMAWKTICADEAKDARRLLEKRSKQLPSPYSQTAAQIALSINEAKHIPAYVLFAQRSCTLPESADAPAMLARSSFDMLVEARSTQRVASPSGIVSREDIRSLWDSSLEHILPHWSGANDMLRFFSFSKTSPVAASIGEAMKNGIDGPDGLLEKINKENIQTRIQGCPSESEPLKAGSLPEHLLFNLTSSGQYRIEKDILLDHKGKALTLSRLVKLVRMLAKSFGRFFLSFQNTHPALGIIMVKEDLDQRKQAKAYEYAGRVAAYMSVLARAKGWVSIIKSGPVEIARAEIQQLVAENIPDTREAMAIEDGTFKALLTFQLGLPLGPTELVSKATAQQHDGLLERKLDKRAPRASLKKHHIPLVEI